MHRIEGRTRQCVISQSLIPRIIACRPVHSGPLTRASLDISAQYNSGMEGTVVAVGVLVGTFVAAWVMLRWVQTTDNRNSNPDQCDTPSRYELPMNWRWSPLLHGRRGRHA